MKKETASLSNLEKMEKEISSFMWWFIDRIIRIPLREDREKLKHLLRNSNSEEYTKIKLNVTKNIPDYVYIYTYTHQSFGIPVNIEEKWITPDMLMAEMVKHF